MDCGRLGSGPLTCISRLRYLFYDFDEDERQRTKELNIAVIFEATRYKYSSSHCLSVVFPVSKPLSLSSSKLSVSMHSSWLSYPGSQSWKREFIKPSCCNQCSRDPSQNLNEILCDLTCLTVPLFIPLVPWHWKPVKRRDELVWHSLQIQKTIEHGVGFSF